MRVDGIDVPSGKVAGLRRPARQRVAMVLMAILVAGPAVLLALLYLGGGTQGVHPAFRLAVPLFLLVLAAAPLVIAPHPGHLSSVTWPGWLATGLLLIAVPAALLPSTELSTPPAALASTRADDEEVLVLRWRPLAIVAGLAIGALVTFGLAWLGQRVRQQGTLRVPAVGLSLLLLVIVLGIYAFSQLAFRSEAGTSPGAAIAGDLAALWWPVGPIVGLLAGAEWRADREAFPAP